MTNYRTMEGVKDCIIGMSCIPIDERTREIELSRRMMKERNKQINKGKLSFSVLILEL